MEEGEGVGVVEGVVESVAGALGEGEAPRVRAGVGEGVALVLLLPASPARH
jgi:hypothetical protein